jgi:hypothetical protein
VKTRESGSFDRVVVGALKGLSVIANVEISRFSNVGWRIEYSIVTALLAD